MDKNVLPELTRRTPVTFELIFYALIMQILFGLIAGVLSVRKKDHPLNYATRLTAFIAASLPEFILALILLSIFYVALQWLPPERLSMNKHLFVQSDSFIVFMDFLTIDGFLNNRINVTIDAFWHLVLLIFTLSFAH